MEDYSLSPTHSQSGLAMLDAKSYKIHRFNCFQDIMLLRAVVDQNPFGNKRHWQSVADTLSPIMPFVSSRRCRERTVRLLNYYRTENHAGIQKSGTEEQYAEKAQLLEEISRLEGGEEKIPTRRRRYDFEDSACSERTTENTNDGKESSDSSAEASGDEEPELESAEATSAGVKRKIVETFPAYVPKKPSNDVSMQKFELKIRMEQLELQKRKLALDERKLDLEEKRWEMEKQERKEDRRMMLKLLEVALRKYEK